MKRFFGYALMLALATAPAFAAKNSQSLTLSQTVKVGSTEFPAGSCNVSWTGTGDSVQVTLAEHGKTVTFPAKLVTQKNAYKGYTVNHVDGSDQLQSIQLSNISLQLEGATASGQ